MSDKENVVVSGRKGTDRCRTGRRTFPLQVHFSSKSDEWSTPHEFFSHLNEEFQFDLDPCATIENAKCKRFFTKSDDGLSKDWGRSNVFMNPPYGRHIEYWMRKALSSAQRGATVVALVPARTDTRWWHEYAAKGEIRFLKGRLKFGGALNAAPFPSAIVIFRLPVTQIGEKSPHFCDHAQVEGAGGMVRKLRR